MKRLLRLVATVAILAPIICAMPAAGARSRPASGTRRVCPLSTSGTRASCFALVRTNGPGDAPFSTGVPVGFGPQQFQAAYGLPASGGDTQTIAIVDAFRNPKIYGDLVTYDSAFGLPPFPRCTKVQKVSCFAVLNQLGLKSPLPTANAGWGLEEALDVEVAHGLCPSCRIDLVEANSDSFSDLEAAVNAAAAKHIRVISNSYGAYGDDCSEPGYDHRHVAVVVAAGDGGFGIACPAALNTVVSVGGTSLRLAPDGSYFDEAAWTGSGSGCSIVNVAQKWQKAIPGWAATGCGAGRGMNDVAADADPASGAAVFDSYDTFDAGGWVTVGGTSLSAPIISAAYALAGNVATLTYPAQRLYTLPSAFHDITRGADGSCIVLPQCQAGPGYDLPTGNGTPNGLAAF